jgi:hypothetical protein
MTKCKSYPFSLTSFEQIRKDEIKKKFDLGFDIVFWGTMGILVVTGVMGEYTLIQMVACSATSKSVKTVMRRRK